MAAKVCYVNGDLEHHNKPTIPVVYLEVSEAKYIWLSILNKIMGKNNLVARIFIRLLNVPQTSL